MPRMTQEQKVTAITAEIQNAGGTITHADLIERLRASGNYEAVDVIQFAADSGTIRAVVKAQPEGRPVLEYSLT